MGSQCRPPSLALAVLLASAGCHDGEGGAEVDSHKDICSQSLLDLWEHHRDSGNKKGPNLRQASSQGVIGDLPTPCR